MVDESVPGSANFAAEPPGSALFSPEVTQSTSELSQFGSVRKEKFANCEHFVFDGLDGPLEPP